MNVIFPSGKMGLVSYLAGFPHPRNSKTPANVTRHWRPRIFTIALFSRCRNRRKVSIFFLETKWGLDGEREVGMKFWMSQYICQYFGGRFGSRHGRLDASRILDAQAKHFSSQISHGVNVVSTRWCRKLNMHRQCWEKLGAWPRVAPSKKITLQSMDPTWCLPVNADPTWTCFLSFLPRQFLKEGDILKGYYLPGKIGN